MIHSFICTEKCLGNLAADLISLYRGLCATRWIFSPSVLSSWLKAPKSVKLLRFILCHVITSALCQGIIDSQNHLSVRSSFNRLLSLFTSVNRLQWKDFGAFPQYNLKVPILSSFERANCLIHQLCVFKWHLRSACFNASITVMLCESRLMTFLEGVFIWLQCIKDTDLTDFLC